jgi:hypothetical protein
MGSAHAPSGFEVSVRANSKPRACSGERSAALQGTPEAYMDVFTASREGDTHRRGTGAVILSDLSLLEFLRRQLMPSQQFVEVSAVTLSQSSSLANVATRDLKDL